METRAKREHLRAILRAGQKIVDELKRVGFKRAYRTLLNKVKKDLLAIVDKSSNDLESELSAATANVLS